MLNKVECIYVILVRDISVDAQDNMNSLLKIIDRFQFGMDKKTLKKVNGPVNVPASFSIASSWKFEEKLKVDEKVLLQFNLIDPSGKDLGGPSDEFVVPKGKDRININFNVNGLTITDEGPYLLSAQMLKNKKILGKRSYPFEVIIHDQQAPSG